MDAARLPSLAAPFTEVAIVMESFSVPSAVDAVSSAVLMYSLM
jgi:hypothetical protein